MQTNEEQKSGYFDREYFKFFRYFAKNGDQQISYLFRIDFQLLMLEIMK